MNQSAKETDINRVISLFNNGEIKECLKETKLIRKKFPLEPFIYNLLGVLHAHMESFEDSIKNYSEAIKLNPIYVEAFNNKGVAYTSWKRFDKAIECFDRAIEINPSYAEAYNNKANALKEKKEYQPALANYEKSIQLEPTYLDALSNAGILCDIMNDYTKSEMYLNRALSLDSNNTSVLYNLANCLFNSKNFKKSIKICQKIIRLDASFHFAYNRMGLCYLHLEKKEEASEFFKKAIEIKADYLESINNYGFVLQKLKNYSLATIQFKRALNIDPHNHTTFINLSKAYFDEGRLIPAIELAKRGLLLKPDSIPLLKNLHLSLLLLNRLDEAEEACKEMLSIDKNDAEAINAMGTIYERQGHYEKAKSYFLRALEIDKNLFLPKINIATIYQLEGHIEKAVEIYSLLTEEQLDNPQVLYQKSAITIALENFEEGWKNYEYRWKVFPLSRSKWPVQNKLIWKGEKGKRVVLWKEQGIGDDIIFLSLVSEVKEMCGSLSVYVDPRLQTLCRRSMPEINFVKDLEELQNVDCDYHMPLGNIPGLIRNDINDFDRTIKGYLKADAERVKSIRKELNLEGKTVIGISWKSFNSLNQFKKSVQLKDMERVFSNLDVVLVNLQYGDVDEEIKAFKAETGIDVLQCASVDNREDLDGLAALIEACDLVISTSNVTIHMAGALGKETWVLLSYVANFWWLLERTDSIWYPSLTLYRQPTLNDWDSVYGSIRKDLDTRLQCN